jgi:MFS family permease
VRNFASVLSGRDFRRLWLGASISTAGDAMTLVALSWLVLNRPGGTGQLGILAVCYTAPVLAGGLMAGPLLDRFDKRAVLAADSVVRGIAVASIPLLAAVERLPSWLPFVVAALYGLFKMVPLAGVPAAIPDLVRPAELDTANALESVSYAVSGIIGFTLAGTLIAAIGPANVLALDAVSFLVFAVAALAVRRPLRHTGGDASPNATAPRPRTAMLLRDRVLVVTTLAFMLFNIAEGALTLVVGPWLAKDHLPGGPGTLSMLLGALSLGELLGSVVAGLRKPGFDRLRAIAVAQITAALGFLAVLAIPHRGAVAAGFLLIGMFSVPMTVWAQSLRMERVPAPLRGRAFSTLRTLMQATPPLGAAAVTPLLAHGRLGAAAAGMAVLAGLPAITLLTLRAGDRDALEQGGRGTAASGRTPASTPMSKT